MACNLHEIQIIDTYHFLVLHAISEQCMESGVNSPRTSVDTLHLIGDRILSN